MQFLEFFCKFFILSIFTSFFIKITKHSPSSSFCTLQSPPPHLAYFISGYGDQDEMLKRVLLAIYHPNNIYAVYLDENSSHVGYQKLYEFIDSHPVFSRIGNVKMIARTGPDRLEDIFLHTAAVLLKEGSQWDWFINLDASSYPLFTQDDLLCALSEVPRNLNFINTSYFILEQDSERSRKVSSDQRLYSLEESLEPAPFHLFSGSPWMGLSRPFVKYCTLGYEYLSPKVLIYYGGSISSRQSYFQTVFLNCPEFHNTTINTDLHYKVRQDHHFRSFHHPFLTMDDGTSMLTSKAPFAREFHKTHSRDVLHWIDTYLLSRGPKMLVPGGWCAGSHNDPCLIVGNVTNLKLSKRARRLQTYFDQLIHDHNM